MKLSVSVLSSLQFFIAVVVGAVVIAAVVHITFFKLTIDDSVLKRIGMAQHSPLIASMSWGSITVQVVEEDGIMAPEKKITYRDAKLWPGGSRGWNWKETGTGHFKGIQIADVDELLSHEPQTIILSKGVLSQLRVPQTTIDYITQLRPDIKVIVETSRNAFATYNSLAAAGERVAALIHTTC